MLSAHMCFECDGVRAPKLGLRRSCCSVGGGSTNLLADGVLATVLLRAKARKVKWGMPCRAMAKHMLLPIMERKVSAC